MNKFSISPTTLIAFLGVLALVALAMYLDHGVIAVVIGAFGSGITAALPQMVKFMEDEAKA